jgi:hypothetical protein
MSFEESLRIGQANEQVVVFLYKNRHWFKTPLTKINMGGAPRMLGLTGELKPIAIIVPDYDMVHLEHEPCGLECKFKADSSETDITGEREHGIGLRLYINYLKWSRCQRRKVILMVTEQSTGEVLAATLDRLRQGHWVDLRDGTTNDRPRIYRGDRMDAGGMAFFGRSQFMVFHQTEPRDMPLFKDHPELVPPTLPIASDLSDVA